MSAYDTPLSKCPYCNLPVEADWVDVGVGMVQCGPYHCEECGASEIGPERFDDPKWTATDEEKRTGFYKGGRISPKANTFQGKPVSHQTAKALYRQGLLDPKPKDDSI